MNNYNASSGAPAHLTCDNCAEMRTFAAVVRLSFLYVRQVVRHNCMLRRTTYACMQASMQCIHTDLCNAMAFAEGFELDYYNL